MLNLFDHALVRAVGVSLMVDVSAILTLSVHPFEFQAVGHGPESEIQLRDGDGFDSGFNFRPLVAFFDDSFAFALLPITERKLEPAGERPGAEVAARIVNPAQAGFLFVHREQLRFYPGSFSSGAFIDHQRGAGHGVFPFHRTFNVFLRAVAEALFGFRHIQLFAAVPLHSVQSSTGMKRCLVVASMAESQGL